MSSRRDFLKSALGSSAVVALGAAAPRFLVEAAERPSNANGETVLVVVQLSGGNDGINTVVPYGDDIYYQNRFTLALDKNKVHKLDDYHALHPSLGGFAKLVEVRRLAIVQGVGYANPNRSHFESMDIWHTARREPQGRSLGWLGRYLDASAKQASAKQAGANVHSDVPALHLGGGQQPLALAALDVHAPSIRSLDQFKLQDGGDRRLREAIERLSATPRPGEDDLLSFVQSSTAAALASSQRMQEALGKYAPAATYPGTKLAQSLSTVAQLIDAGLSTRIYYVSLDGFDTHSEQGDAHASLLAELGDAVKALVDDLAGHGHADRVLVMSFSEFGRRVRENASRGTDHGAAAPMFLAGGKVKPGLIGKHPSMADLDNGDLKHHTDFRAIYAAVLKNWLGWSAGEILGGEYEPADVLA
ncbi:MAG: DUF1501 domain-containing protein [Pirellulales bacterium]